ncbi:MAG TPA: 6-phosphogluconolactonase [Thermoanaerobaculia bacterium]|nr:6-phosphogluconolactonase [Thermoanaerobaculia bacterium]
MAELSEVRVFSDAAELARAAAEAVAEAAGETARHADRFTLALSGGSTPEATYRLLASREEPFRDRLPWSLIHFFWGDERHVPPDHPESNFRMASRAMLDAVPVPPGNIHPIPGEEPDAARAAGEYEAELRSSFQLSRGEPPRFDLVLLGLGADGHTASLFPGTRAIHERERLVVAHWVDKLGAFRITLTPPVFNAAARVIFLVSGETKAGALRAVLRGDFEPDRVPAQIVRPVNGSLVWMVDRKAARDLAAAG